MSDLRATGHTLHISTAQYQADTDDEYQAEADEEWQSSSCPASLCPNGMGFCGIELPGIEQRLIGLHFLKIRVALDDLNVFMNLLLLLLPTSFPRSLLLGVRCGVFFHHTYCHCGLQL